VQGSLSLLPLRSWIVKLAWFVLQVNSLLLHPPTAPLPRYSGGSNQKDVIPRLINAFMPPQLLFWG
jgi:hypothetical protein